MLDKVNRYGTGTFIQSKRIPVIYNQTAVCLFRTGTWQQNMKYNDFMYIVPGIVVAVPGTAVVAAPETAAVVAAPEIVVVKAVAAPETVVVAPEKKTRVVDPDSVGFV
jgi:hypothetical protein